MQLKNEWDAGVELTRKMEEVVKKEKELKEREERGEVKDGP